MIKDVSPKPIRFHEKKGHSSSGVDFGELGYLNSKVSFVMSEQMKTAVKQLEFYFDINTPIVCIQNHDFARFDLIIKQVAHNKGIKDVKEWNPALGRTNFITQKATSDQKDDAIQPLSFFLKSCLTIHTENVVVLKDVQEFINEQYPDVLSAIHYSAYRKLYDKPENSLDVEWPAKGYNTTIIILSSVPFTMPKCLVPYTEYLELETPDTKEIENMINSHISVSNNVENKLNQDQMQSFVRSMQGMSAFDIDRLLDSVISENGNLTTDDTKSIKEKQRQVVKNSGLLELIDSDIEESDVGGLDYLIDYLEKKANVMKDISQAEKYGVGIPKGILLVGMPSCGKSLSAKMAAKKFNNIPLLKMDMGSLQGGLVGDSERNMREALKQAEQVSPCILWIDEIEKAFSGTSGSNNEAYTMRMFGYFLSWMQDHTKPVFVFATANSVDNLKPEFLRAGRFDEKFVLNLPTEDELKKILKARLACKKRHLEKLYKESDIEYFVSIIKDKKFNGADIENAINNTLEIMFFEGVNRNEFVKRFTEMLKITKGIGETQKSQIEQMKKSFKEYKFIDATSGPDGKYVRKSNNNILKNDIVKSQDTQYHQSTSRGNNSLVSYGKNTGIFDGIKLGY